MQGHRGQIGILGYGVVGKAIEEIYRESFFGQPVIKDLDRDEFDGLGILNVCIPYSEDFENIVIKEMEKNKPNLTIIHSTVIPYTTKNIREKTKMYVVHSPIQGQHDNLARSIKIFSKFIGAEKEADAELACEHFKFLGLKKYLVYKPAVITEINKLVSTTYYGVCIAFTDYIDKLFQKYNIPFKTFEKFNESYNRGYRRLKLRKVNRPTLIPPRGRIGGSCLVKNTQFIQECLDHKLIQAILEVR